MSNCLYGSLIQRVKEDCGCSPTFASRVTDDLTGQGWCEGARLACLERTITNWGEADSGLDSVYNSVTGREERCLSACYSQKVEPTTTSTSYPSQYTFPRRTDYCHVIRKIDKICRDKHKRIVFERHYRDKFSCATFPTEVIEKCTESPRTAISDKQAEEAATEYARDNLALIKIFIRSWSVQIINNERVLGTTGWQRLKQIYRW